MKRGEKWFPEKLRKFFDLEYFRSDSFSIRTSRIESSRFRARVAKGRPAFRDRITRRSLESKIVYRGVGADFESKKIFSANNEQGSMKRGEKWFSEKLRKIFDLEYFRSESFSIRTSCIESSSFRARVAKGRPASEIALPGESSSPPPQVLTQPI